MRRLNRKVATLVVAAAALTGGLVLTQSNEPQTSGPAVQAIPRGSGGVTGPTGGAVCNISPATGNTTPEAMKTAINSCPDGTVGAETIIRFPPAQDYTIVANGTPRHGRIEVESRNNIIIDGNNSTFRMTACGADKGVVGNWIVLFGTNVTLKNLNAIGSFNVTYERDLGRYSTEPCYSESMFNFGFYGLDTGWLIDSTGTKAWGDAVTTNPAHYALGYGYRNNDYANDIHVVRLAASRVSRHCFSPNSGSGFWLENSTCYDAWYAGLDAETDERYDPLNNHHYLYNRFERYFTGGILVPVPGTKAGQEFAVAGPVGDIEIRGNTFIGTPPNTGAYMIIIGGYPNIDFGDDPTTPADECCDPPRTDYHFYNIVVEENIMSTYCHAVKFDHVSSGSISYNKITTLPTPGGGTPEQYCGAPGTQVVLGSTQSPAPIVNTNDVGAITITDNGPDAGLPPGGTTTTTQPATTTTTAPGATTTTSTILGTPPTFPGGAIS